MSSSNHVGVASHDESLAFSTQQLIEVVELISPEEISELNRDLQDAVTRAMSHRKAAAFARGVGVLNSENDPIAKPIITAINGVLSRFFDEFFTRNPSLDASVKTQILEKYKN